MISVSYGVIRYETSQTTYESTRMHRSKSFATTFPIPCPLLIHSIDWQRHHGHCQKPPLRLCYSKACICSTAPGWELKRSTTMIYIHGDQSKPDGKIVGDHFVRRQNWKWNGIMTKRFAMIIVFITPHISSATNEEYGKHLIPFSSLTRGELYKKWRSPQNLPAMTQNEHNFQTSQ